MSLVRLPLVALGALLGLGLAGCGSRTSLGGFGWSASSGGTAGSGGGIASGGASPTGGAGAVGGLPAGGSPSGGAPSGGAPSGGSGGTIEPVTGFDYFKSNNPRDEGVFGAHVALSADGQTLVVATPGDRSAASGINGDPLNEDAPASGAVYVYVKSGDTWVEQAYLKAAHPTFDDLFGTALALSADGNRLVVGAVGEDSSAVGIDGDQLSEAAEASGAVYVFGRSAGVWTQEAYVKAPNTEAADQFGRGIALSADGLTMAVGAAFESGSAIGVNGDQTINGALYSGAVYVFADDGVGFYFQAYVKASNTSAHDRFGSGLALSGDGNTLVVGSPYEDSSSTGPFDQFDESAFNAGAAYVFSRTGSLWAQSAYVKASNTGSGDNFGIAVACSTDGSTIAIGAHSEQSLSSGVNSSQIDDSGVDVGAVYVHEWTGSAYEQVAYVKASNPQSAYFGTSLTLSANGEVLLVGATAESSPAVGIDGPQDGTSAPWAGAAYLFVRGDSAWRQQTYIKANNTSAGDAHFGYSVALDASATMAAIGAPYENGSSPGINGDLHDLTTNNAGAVFVYQLD